MTPNYRKRWTALLVTLAAALVVCNLFGAWPFSKPAVEDAILRSGLLVHLSAWLTWRMIAILVIVGLVIFCALAIGWILGSAKRDPDPEQTQRYIRFINRVEKPVGTVDADLFTHRKEYAEPERDGQHTTQSSVTSHRWISNN